MTTDERIVELCEVFRVELKSDYVGFWQLVKRTASTFDSTINESIMEKSLAVTRELLNLGIVVGDLTRPNGFVAWDVQLPDIVVSKITSSWKSLGGLPDIGDVCWFNSP